MDYKALDQYLEAHLPELLKDLDTLVSINSERTEAKEGMPFGEGNAACSAAGMEIIERCGFAARNYENYVITADLNPELEQGLDILAHLDVVPAGNGWTVADPFTMKIVDDKVYGRGTADDKGPALCALYAMRAIKDLEFPVHKNVRLILGADEECGSSDLKYYFTKESSAPYSLSPDADFPMINIEKGGLGSGFYTDAKAATEGARVISITAGIKGNVIPDTASAVVKDIEEAIVKEKCEEISAIDGISAAYTVKGDEIELTVTGSTGHASMPETANNAITALLKLLAALPLSEAEVHEQIRQVSRLFPHGDYYGAALGVDLEDEESGRTVLSLTICNFNDEKGFYGTFDCRACLSANDENTTAVVDRKFREAGLNSYERKMFGPHYVPEDSELIQTLLDVYEDMTGSRPKPLCIGGGTYVHHIDNGVAFGCGFEGLDNKLHGPDEFMTMEQILFTCKIYARTILALCNKE